MNKKKIAILGSGISGLSLAHYIRKFHPDIKITIFEKNLSPGGVMGRVQTSGYVFDTGPKTFKASRSEPLLDLIYDYGLEHQIKRSSKEAQVRFLYHKNKLRALPQSPFATIRSKMTRKALFPLIREMSKKPQYIEDESVYSFIKRRLGPYIAETFFDPLTLGIYASTLDKLSINVCFPKFKTWEKQYGSIIQGLLKERPKSQSSKYSYLKGSLFTLDGGIYNLIEKMAENFSSSIKYHETVEEISYEPNKLLKVVSNGKTYLFDYIFSALPLQSLKDLKLPKADVIQSELKSMQSVGIVSVSMEFEKNVLPVSGFGYLTQSKDLEDLLGVVFDSKIFKASDGKDRLTIMMGGSVHPEFLQLSDEELCEKAFRALQKHTGIQKKPNEVFVRKFPNAIPLFAPFHKTRVEKLESIFNTSLPGFYLAGNFLKNASVSSCILTSLEKAKALCV